MHAHALRSALSCDFKVSPRQQRGHSGLSINADEPIYAADCCKFCFFTHPGDKPSPSITPRSNSCLVWLLRPVYSTTKNGRGCTFRLHENSARSAGICKFWAPEWKVLKTLWYLCKQGATLSVKMVTCTTLLFEVKIACCNTAVSLQTYIANYWPGLLATVFLVVIVKAHHFWHCPCVHFRKGRSWQCCHVNLALRKAASLYHLYMIDTSCRFARLHMVWKQAHGLGFKQTPQSLNSSQDTEQTFTKLPKHQHQRMLTSHWGCL